MNADSRTTLLAAPLQGFTDAAWRNAHAAVFGGVEAYLAPFMRVEHGTVRRRDVADVTRTPGMAPTMPQILASPPAEAVLMATTLRAMGHTLVDINLGCPHPPVARKGRGSGMLAHPERLGEMCRALAEVDGVTYTVKMRLGFDSPTQWRQALPQLECLHPRHITVHPRTASQLYRGELLIDEFEALLAATAVPIVFNGELRTAGQVAALLDRYPRLTGVMVGRGLVAHPAMLTPEKCDSAHFAQFHQALLEGESKRLTGGEHQLLQHMQALWAMMLPDADKRLRRQVAKARCMAQYQAAVGELIAGISLP